MAIKNFKNEENQKAWDQYSESKLSGLEGEEYDKKKMSVNQYKPVLLELDNYTINPFEELTSEELQAFFEVATKKNRENHVRGFLLTCVNNNYITLKKDVLVWIIPEEYRKVMIKIMQ